MTARKALLAIAGMAGYFLGTGVMLAPTSAFAPRWIGIVGYVAGGISLASVFFVNTPPVSPLCPTCRGTGAAPKEPR